LATEIRNKLTTGRVVEPKYPYIRLVMSVAAQRDPDVLFTDLIDHINGHRRVPDALVKRLLTDYRRVYNRASWDVVHDWLAAYFRLQRAKGRGV